MAASASETSAAGQGEIEFDPPLGKFPPMSFMHPVLYNASARWKTGGGSAGLVALLKCAPPAPARAAANISTCSSPPSSTRDGSNLKAFRTLVRFTCAMFGVPALTMALSYFVLPMLVGAQSYSQRMTFAGIAGICSVQVVIVAYLVLAFAEAPADAAQKKET